MLMAKRTDERIPKERVSIVVSRDARKHLSFIALERELSTPGEAVDYLLTYFDRTGKLKKKAEGAEPVQGVDMSKIPEYAI